MTNYGPGCYTTAFFSENAVLEKSLISGQIRLASCAGQTMQLLDRFVFFPSLELELELELPTDGASILKWLVGGVKPTFYEKRV